MFDAWCEDIGEKIKDWAIKNYIIGIVLSVIAGIICFIVGIDGDSEMTVVGLLVILVGIAITAAGSTLLYGFGELIENTCQNAANTSAILRLLQNTEKDNGNALAAQSNTAQQRSSLSISVPNGWTCTCGRVHAPYESSCVCGATKNDVKSQSKQNN